MTKYPSLFLAQPRFFPGHHLKSEAWSWEGENTPGEMQPGFRRCCHPLPPSALPEFSILLSYSWRHLKDVGKGGAPRRRRPGFGCRSVAARAGGWRGHKPCSPERSHCPARYTPGSLQRRSSPFPLVTREISGTRGRSLKTSACCTSASRTLWKSLRTTTR